MIRRVLFLVVALAAGSVAVAAVAQEVLFAYAFEAGSSHRYRVKLSQQLDFGGNAMAQYADFEVTVKCLSVADGKAAMEMTFDKADMSREMFGNMSADPLAEMVVGKGLTFTVDAMGDVTDIKQAGYYDGWDQMRSFVEPLVKGWYVRLPNKAYAPGADWEQADNEKGSDGSDVAMKAHYRYKENKKQGDRQCAAVTGDVTSEVTGQSTTPMGAYNVQGGGEGKAEFLFDGAARLMVKLKSKMTIDMDLTPAAGGDAVQTSVTYQMERELL